MNYQTVLLPDGKIVDGLFPSVLWFNKIKQYVNFQNKSVIDLGCNLFSYGLQAISNGANLSIGIEKSSVYVTQVQQWIKQYNLSRAYILEQDIETYLPDKKYDICIFGMILHWLKTPKQYINQIKPFIRDYIIFIYRPKTSVEDFGFRPTQTELNNLLGLSPILSEPIGEEIKQNIMLTIYKNENN